MEYRMLGGSGLKVPELCFGLGTFGGGTEFFKAWGDHRRRRPTHRRPLPGRGRELLRYGRRLLEWPLRADSRRRRCKGKRDEVLISTKATFPLRRGAERRRLVALSPDRSVSKAA